MIDNPKLTADLLRKLEAALPVPAIITPFLANALRKQAPEASIPGNCQIVWVYNMGDAGGILCKLSVEGELPAEAQDEGEKVFLASITHLDFDHRHPLAHEIAAYQKRRVKKLRQRNG
jgi:hypothetical protein